MKKKLLSLSVLVLMLAVYLSPRYPVFAETVREMTYEQSKAFRSASNSAKPSAPPKMSQAMERLAAQKEKQATKSAERADKKQDILAKLKTFKDQKKASVAARFSENLNKVNQQRTQQLSEHLTKMKDLLSRLESLLLGVSGLDTTALNEQLTNTNALIKVAEASVSAQKAKQYALTITTESAVRLDAQSAKNTLQKDLEAVHNSVKNARKSLSDSLSNIVRLIGGAEKSEGETDE